MENQAGEAHYNHRAHRAGKPTRRLETSSYTTFTKQARVTC